MQSCVISCETVVFFQKSRNLSRSLLTNNNFYCEPIPIARSVMVLEYTVENESIGSASCEVAWFSKLYHCIVQEAELMITFSTVEYYNTVMQGTQKLKGNMQLVFSVQSCLQVNLIYFKKKRTIKSMKLNLNNFLYFHES